MRWEECNSCNGQGCEGCHGTGEYNPTGQYLRESDYREYVTGRQRLRG